MQQDISIGPAVLSAPGDVVVVTEGASTCSISLSSISSPAGFSWAVQGTIDGTHWFPISIFDPTTVGTYVHGTQTSLTGQWVAPCAGLIKVRFHMTAVGSGSAIISMVASDGVAPVLIAGGTVALVPSFVNLAPATSGGLSQSSYLISNDVAAHVVKASAGQLYAVETFNNSNTLAYLKIYNATTATAGAGTPVARLLIPEGAFSYRWENGVAYGTGITGIVTTGIADNDSAAPAASQFIVNFYWK